MRLIRPVATTLLAAMLACFSSPSLPAFAKSSAAKSSARAAVKTVSGEIADWSDSAFSLKVGAVCWKFTYDKAHFAQIGKAAVGAQATVKYTKDGSSNVASSIRVKK